MSYILFNILEKVVDLIWDIFGFDEIYDDDESTTCENDDEELSAALEQLKNVEGCWAHITYPSGLRELIWVTEDAINIKAGEE